MAKRPSSRTDTQTDDTASVAPGALKPRRARVRSATSTSVQEAAAEAADMGNAPEQTEGAPSENDIRTRAYHRFLERGGGHGQHFDDWIEAERELKSRK
ncbi:MAG: hypothetical protein DMG01_02295 [Acidobacteria bacterium]|nr:MAG: hypothetical protein DMG01_02295 [Acidobacteriota bacterium]